LKKIVLLSFVFLLFSTAVAIRFVRPVVAEETIYIRPDGTVEGTDKIQRDGNVYTFTENINDSIIVERDNIVVDGVGHTLQGTESGYGIDLSDRNNVTIRNMQISAFDYGVYLVNAFDNRISGNTIANNWIGIEIRQSSQNLLRNNIFTENDYPLVVGTGDQSFSYYVQDIDTSNTINGKPIYYLVNQNNKTIPADAGYVATVNCTKITVEVLHLDTNFVVLLAFTNRSTVKNLYGSNLFVKLERSSSNIISNNTIGSLLIEFSTNNAVFGNTIIGKSGTPILWVQYENYNNSFHHNNFVGITEWWQINSYQSLNVYEENYWSDYNGTDFNSGPYQNETGSDGIGDTPYVIDENNQDNYPLMGTFYDFTVEIEMGQISHVRVISNSTVSNLEVRVWLTSPNEYLQQGDKFIYYFVDGEEGSVGFCRVLIPRAVLNDSYIVLVDWQEVPVTELPISNSTHAYLYFTYNHSTHEVVIVPEFATWASMLLMLVVLTVSMVVYKRRLLKTPKH